MEELELEIHKVLGRNPPVGCSGPESKQATLSCCCEEEQYGKGDTIWQAVTTFNSATLPEIWWYVAEP